MGFIFNSFKSREKINTYFDVETKVMFWSQCKCWEVYCTKNINANGHIMS